MKKNLVLLTGIVFLITILAAGGCSKGNKPNGSEKEIIIKNSTRVIIIKDSTRVEIHLKDTLIDGEKHLKMYDSNDPDNVVVDSLYTWVLPGMKVIWKFDRQSGIKNIKKIGSSKEGRKIFKEDARKKFLSKKFKLRIPNDAPWETTEEYDIKFEDKDGKTWLIDPYLRLPKQE
jgi:hypothetical protein